MRSGLLRLGTLFTFALACFFSLNCGNKQELVSIQVTPTQVNFQGFGAQAQMTAMGSYIHPPATKDISNIVTWATDAPGAIEISSTGLVTAINKCGSGQITATAYSNPGNPSAGSAIRGSADFAVLLNGSPNCSQLANLTVSVVATGTASGTVISSPLGINCPGACSANFTVGAPVTLTASPAGTSSTVTWGGCDSTSLGTCFVTMNGARIITATFS